MCIRDRVSTQSTWGNTQKTTTKKHIDTHIHPKQTTTPLTMLSQSLRNPEDKNQKPFYRSSSFLLTVSLLLILGLFSSKGSKLLFPPENDTARDTLSKDDTANPRDGSTGSNPDSVNPTVGTQTPLKNSGSQTFLPGGAAPLACLDDKGTPSDFFFLYRYASKRRSGDDEDFLYVGRDSSTDHASQSNMGLTLEQINERFTELELLVFNTETRREKDGTCVKTSKPTAAQANSRGVIAVDPISQQGIFFTHSEECFPEVSPEGTRISTLPQKGSSSGQGAHFACFTLKASDLYALAADYISMGVKPSLNTMKGLATTGGANEKLKEGAKKLQTIGGLSLTEISKASKPEATSTCEEKYFFENAVAKEIGGDLIVKSSRPSIDKATCKASSSTINVVMYLNHGSEDWNAQRDSSKWVLSESSSTVCVSDLDRSLLAIKQGGKVFCFENAEMKKRLNEVIKKKRMANVISLSTRDSPVKRAPKIMIKDKDSIRWLHRENQIQQTLRNPLLCEDLSISYNNLQSLYNQPILQELF
eukprot:TRINITY_DN4393_c0_g1_i1.p1 TRINITY_DN4393_c0_g1~~TRINITY_DN4393_c0_g1_i1.p1  ORF type:complete len:560 (+),score=145.71 TRINITY_DN4393_c0_g1_i1:85-1680(+)